MAMSEKVPPESQLSTFIGDILRNDLHTQHEMTVFRSKLEFAGLPVAAKKNIWYATLIERILTVLDRGAIPLEFRDIAVAAVNAASDAHDIRNDVAHELLTQDYTDEAKYRSVLRWAEPPRPLAELEAHGRQILRANWRMRGVWIIAPFWIGGPIEIYDDANNLRSWTRVAMDQIADSTEGIRGTPGESPEPPGGYASMVSPTAH